MLLLYSAPTLQGWKMGQKTQEEPGSGQCGSQGGDLVEQKAFKPGQMVIF
jgi:hypothetical protein